jgi:hypothetical protein
MRQGGSLGDTQITTPTDVHSGWGHALCEYNLPHFNIILMLWQCREGSDPKGVTEVRFTLNVSALVNRT